MRPFVCVVLRKGVSSVLIFVGISLSRWRHTFMGSFFSDIHVPHPFRTTALYCLVCISNTSRFVILSTALHKYSLRSINVISLSKFNGFEAYSTPPQLHIPYMNLIPIFIYFYRIDYLTVTFDLTVRRASPNELV